MANGKSRKCICLRQQGGPAPGKLGRCRSGRRRDGVIRKIKEKTHFVIFQPFVSLVPISKTPTDPKASGAKLPSSRDPGGN